MYVLPFTKILLNGCNLELKIVFQSTKVAISYLPLRRPKRSIFSGQGPVQGQRELNPGTKTKLCLGEGSLMDLRPEIAVPDDR